ncbi:Translation initiation factor IF-3 [Galdieria sulphuraria]|nr:Translation initiation factor IF-3 [Galdieria sulphuraria]
MIGHNWNSALYHLFEQARNNSFSFQLQRHTTCTNGWQTYYRSPLEKSPCQPRSFLLQREFTSNVHSRTNESVRKFKEVLLVNEKGERVGVMSGEQAYQYAANAQQDVMEVSAKAAPPVWKLVDLKQVLRANRLREKMERKQAVEQRRKSEVKEIRISPAIDDHDFQVKVDRAKEFLSTGRRVRFSVRFRRGQGKYASRLESLAERIKEQLKDIPCTIQVKRKPRPPPREGASTQNTTHVSQLEEEQDPFELYIEPTIYYNNIIEDSTIVKQLST